MRLSIVIGLAACFFSTGCRQLNEWLDKRIDEKVAAAGGLEQRIQALEGQLKSLDSRVGLLELPHYQSVALDPGVKVYGRVDSSVGSFVLYVDAVRDFADGCEVVLRIGNPMSFTVTDATLHATWGGRRPRRPGLFDDLLPERSLFHGSDAEFDAEFSAVVERAAIARVKWDAWQKALVSTDVSIANPLQPGTWNKVEVRLAPCKPSDLGYLEVSLDAKTLWLSYPP